MRPLKKKKSSTAPSAEKKPLPPRIRYRRMRSLANGLSLKGRQAYMSAATAVILVECSGTPREIDQQTGESLREEIRMHRALYPPHAGPAWEQGLPQKLHAAKTHLPAALEEMQGMEEGADVPAADIDGLNFDVYPNALVAPEGRSNIIFTNIQEWQTGGDAKELMVGGLVAQLLALYIRGGAARTVPERPRAPVWTALERGLVHIHARHADPHLTLDGMAQAAGLSRHYFCRVFRAELGMSPYQYLLRYRIDQAQRLLLGSKWNCSEAALRTGFPSIHQFSKVFCRLTGRSSSKWRKHPG